MVQSAHSGAPAAPGGAEDPAAILIRTPNWLGDLLMSTSFVRAVLHRFPESRVDLIVRSGFEVLPLPHRGEIFPFDRTATSAGAFGKTLRERGYSHLFVLPPSFSSAWMAFRSGIPHRIGYGGQGRGWLLRPAHRHRRAPRSAHLAQEFLDLLRPWLVAAVETGMEGGTGIGAAGIGAAGIGAAGIGAVGEAESPAGGRFPAGLELPPGWVEANRPAGPDLTAGHDPAAPFVVLAPGAEYGPAKQWPTAYYAETAAALRRAGWRVIVAGLAKERPLGEAILAGGGGEGRGNANGGGLNLCGETSLSGLTALIAEAALLISNDSGAMHLGAALGRPQIALFGSTNPHWTAPLNPRAQVVYRGEPCSPCYARECPLGHLRCFTELRPGEVITRALAMLESRRNGN